MSKSFSLILAFVVLVGLDSYGRRPHDSKTGTRRFIPRATKPNANLNRLLKATNADSLERPTRNLPTETPSRAVDTEDEELPVGRPRTEREFDGCRIAGCSAHFCIDPVKQDGISTCEWENYYGCFRLADCRRKTSGTCDWDYTPEVLSCLRAKDAPAEYFR